MFHGQVKSLKKMAMTGGKKALLTLAITISITTYASTDSTSRMTEYFVLSKYKEVNLLYKTALAYAFIFMLASLV